MRIRSIKPEFWRSEDIARLPRDLRLLFVGLWSYVDDNGVGVDDFRQIAADLFAMEDDPRESREFVREGLARLASGETTTDGTPLVARYTVDGRAYLFITKWDKHQKVDRPNKPRYPRPGERLTSDDPEQDGLFASPSRGSRETPASGTGEQRNRGTEEQESSPDSATPRRDDVEKICARMHERVIENGFKKPNITQTWRDEARLLFDRDGRDFDQAMRLVDWATNHHFWRNNIRGIPKFRAQYDQLLGQARNEQSRRQAPRESTTDQRVAQAQALKAKYSTNVVPITGNAS